MEKIKEQLGLFFKKHRKEFFYMLLIGFLGYASYVFYVIFNPQTDRVYQTKVMEEIKSVDLNFNKKTIEKIKVRNITGKEISPVVNGKNPFDTY